VTPSMLSGWELGRHVTSIGHRAMLCEIFGQPPDALFAHQDEQLASGSAALRLLAGWDALQSAMLATVAGARECLVVTGSRSRDRKYLEAIEVVLAERPSLVCYRVLFGPPHHQVLKDHLLELLRLRDPGDRSLGVKTLHVGMVEDVAASPERFFCASERMAVIPVPSLTSHEAFDCGIALGADAALRLLDHGCSIPGSPPARGCTRFTTTLTTSRGSGSATTGTAAGSPCSGPSCTGSRPRSGNWPGITPAS
jgi:hypothetical protein